MPWFWWLAAVAAASAGTNLAALTVPPSLATSEPLAAVNPGTRTVLPFGVVTELLPLTTSARPACAPAGPSTRYSAGLMGPTLPLLTWVARARMPAISGADSDVPCCESRVMSGTERMGLRVMPATPVWYEGRGYTEE